MPILREGWLGDLKDALVFVLDLLALEPVW